MTWGKERRGECEKIEKEKGKIKKNLTHPLLTSQSEGDRQSNAIRLANRPGSSLHQNMNYRMSRIEKSGNE